MSRPAGVMDVRYQEDIASVRTVFQFGLAVAFLAFLALVPWISPRWVLHLTTLAAIMVTAATGLFILTGLCGQISLGHAAFIAVGAYTTAVLTRELGMNFFLTIPLAGLAAGLIGLVFGSPSLRLKGLYLAMATLAAHFIILQFFHDAFKEVLGSFEGLLVPYATLGGKTFSSLQDVYFVVMAVTVIMFLLARNINRSRLGRAFVAVRDNDLAAEILGIRVFRYKLLAFFIGCFYAGVAGSLWALFWLQISPEQFTLMDSIWYVGILIVGGLSSTLGPILGTIFIVGARELSVQAIVPIAWNIPGEIGIRMGTAAAMIVVGLLLVLFLIYEPRGLAHRWDVMKARLRNWPFTYGRA